MRTTFLVLNYIIALLYLYITFEAVAFGADDTTIFMGCFILMCIGIFNVVFGHMETKKKRKARK